MQLKHYTKAIEELDRLQGLLGSGTTPLNIWNELFTAEDKAGFGYLIENAFGREHVVAVWARLRGISPLEATIDLVEKFWMPSRITVWLRREADLSTTNSENEEVSPEMHWDVATGNLYFDGKIIRHVRSMTLPTRVQQILDLFQRKQWPKWIDLPEQWDQQTVHQTLNSLNKGLKAIRFHARNGGEQVHWGELLIPSDLQVNSVSPT